MLKVGIIGCGNISHYHYEGFERAGAQIVHVCDLYRDAAQVVGDRYGARVSTDYREVMENLDVELVSITTVASTHKEICLSAIASGKGVVCEKTLTDNPADSMEIARASDRAGTFFATAYMKRFFPAVRQAKAMLEDMGEIISIHARTWQPWDLWNCSLDNDMTTHPSLIKRKYGGGVLVCGGSHILDLIHYFAGRPNRVCGTMNVREGMDIDRQVNALLWLENGGIVNLEGCFHPLSYAGYERNGWDERLEINTTKGRLELYTVKWDKPTNNGALLIHQDARTGRSTEYRYEAVNPFNLEMADMVRSYEAGDQASPSVWDGYVVDELIAHISTSSEQNSVLDVAWRDSLISCGTIA